MTFDLEVDQAEFSLDGLFDVAALTAPGKDRTLRNLEAAARTLVPNRPENIADWGERMIRLGATTSDRAGALRLTAYRADVTLDRIERDDAGTVMMYLTDGSSRGPFRRPLLPIRHAGAWGAGVQFLNGDLFTDAGSTYLALRLFKGGDSAEADVNAGYALLLSKGGKDAADGVASQQNFKGAWSQTQTYVHGDLVQVIVSRTNSALWRAFDDGIPPGVAPGSDPRWGRVSVEATNDIRFHHNGPMLDGAILGGGVVTQNTYLQAALAGSRVYASGVRAVNVQVYVNGTLVATSATVGAGNAIQTATWTGLASGQLLKPGDVVTAKLQYAVKDSPGVTTGSATDAVVVALVLV
ncbi:hypothetical protein [Methylobacterium komagatae]